MYEIESGISFESFPINLVKLQDEEKKYVEEAEFYSSVSNPRYKPHYEKLINRAKTRVIEGYVEKHHIVPKCLGGSNDKSNLVKLTAEEHYVAHQLLVKMLPENKKLIHAAILMTSKSCDLKRSKNKSYGWLKKLRNESLIGHEVSEATRIKISKGHLGRVNGPRSEETKNKISESNKGRIVSESHRKAVAEANKRRIVSEESKNKRRETMKGFKHTEESKLKMSQSQRNIERKVLPETIARCYEMAKNNIGRKHTEESKAKLSKSLKNRVLSEEAKNNISKAVSEANRNRIITPEQRKTMSKSQTGRKASEETKAKRSASMKATLKRKREALLVEPV